MYHKHIYGNCSFEFIEKYEARKYFAEAKQLTFKVQRVQEELTA